MIALVLSALLAADAGDQAFLEQQAVEAAALEPVPTATSDARWEKAAAKSFHVSAQRTVKLNDKAANEKLHGPGAGEVKVRAAASAKDLAVLLEWSDPTEDRLRADENGFGDAAALELPAKLGPTERLPYVGMGDRDSPVYVYLQRAGEKGETASAFVAQGFGSLTRLKENPASFQLSRDQAKGTWRALFRRPLVVGAHSLEQGLVPFAIAVWDGARSERGGNKQLSAWHYLRLTKYPIDPQYLAQESWGYHGELGDPAKGKQLAEAVCTSCHQLPGKRLAMVGFAPDLSDIGVTSTLPYLRDSVAEPSKVVVHHLQLNSHYVKSGSPDKNGAYPNLEQMAWFNAQPDGGWVSKMPPFGFQAAQLSDIVAFLRTLDGSSEQ